MKSRAILFSGPLIRALLNTKPDVWPAEPIDPALPFKWMTRRICKHSPIASGPNWNVWYSDKIEGQVNDAAFVKLHCPHGAPGDLLWVREGLIRDGGPWSYRADNTPVMVDPHTETAAIVWAHHKQQDYCPSIHMPRWASRLTLEVESVRVERVRDITEEDARAEGLAKTGHPATTNYSGAFAQMWVALHGADSWASSDWVWAITFKRLSQEVAQRRLVA